MATHWEILGDVSKTLASTKRKISELKTILHTKTKQQQSLPPKKRQH
jgi:hypothetical protein